MLIRELSQQELYEVSGGYFYFVAIVIALASCSPESETIH